jgi:hypothetical protein
MVRTLLGIISVIGALGVGLSALNASDPLTALKAIGVGVALLVFVAALGLADLIDASHRVRDAVDDLDETAAQVRDGVTRLRQVLLARAEESGGTVDETD